MAFLAPPLTLHRGHRGGGASAAPRSRARGSGWRPARGVACRAQQRGLPPAPVVVPVFRTENIGDAWDITPVTDNVYWRLMLMSDGHLEGHLHVLTGGQLHLQLVETLLVPSPPRGEVCVGGGSEGELFQELPLPWRRRRIHLVDGHGRVLVHATSWWDATLYDRVMGADESRTIWQALNDAEFGIARKVVAVEYGPCPPELERDFACGDQGVWARHVVLKRDRRPMVILCEILAPALQHHLGPMTGPFEGYEELLEKSKRLI